MPAPSPKPILRLIWTVVGPNILNTSIKFTTTPLTSPLRLGYNYLIKSSIIQCSPSEKATWVNFIETHIFVLTNHTINFEVRANRLLLFPIVTGNILEEDKMVVVVVILLAIGLNIWQEDNKVIIAWGCWGLWNESIPMEVSIHFYDY